ncbi:hypothetical protein BOTBODRAFT_27258 [Botryobasidium botryosum FD-172 SS1]|uniref:Queuosine 5'-phosphate N-glycosylase/hydrolase n=1 Tax=Botryobasidium botryosum (strain FD-172 SS1) TaxID=930990 RepID=A0A067MW83_BOTB1|nr:hypothetical protein BOTBODRAFT_27258 [Botryobasidium botryosum FD-172 SS1]
MSAGAVNDAPFPPTGQYIACVHDSAKAARELAGIQINQEAIARLLRSPAFLKSFKRLSLSHGVVMPLNFDDEISELNLISILGLLNFASGYRAPLHAHNGRGAYDTIRAFVLTLFLTSATGPGPDNHLSSAGMRAITNEQVAELMQLPTHVERPHPTIPGVTVGERGGPLLELIELVTRTMNQAGSALVKEGHKDLGSFVAKALEDAKKAGDAKGQAPDAGVLVERLVTTIPGFRDMTLIKDQPVYVFKKALFLAHAIVLRFGPNSTRPAKSHLPVPDTSTLPVFSDNVLPSMLIYFGVLDLSHCAGPLRDAFRSVELAPLLREPQPSDDDRRRDSAFRPKVVDDGPTLAPDDAYVLRAAAIDACEAIVRAAREIGSASHADGSLDAAERALLAEMTLPEVDGWIWAVAKDRPDYRLLPRFVQRGTPFF